MKEFLLRFSVLAQLQRFWMDGQSYLKVIICSKADAETAAACDKAVNLALLPRTVEDQEDDNVGNEYYSCDASDSSIDLKPILVDETNEKTEESTNSVGHEKIKKNWQPMIKPTIISCKDCGEVFNTQISLRKHVSAVHKKKSHKKKIKVNLAAGEKDEANDSHVQPSSNDVKSVPDDPGSTKYDSEQKCICPICKYVAKTSDRLEKHVKVHETKMLTCTECGYHTWNRGTMRDHMYTHSGEKPIRCRICDKGFAQLSSRNYHEKTHTDERPYVCSICGKLFKRPSLLKIHMKVHADIKTHVCTECGARFLQKCGLQVHMRTHSGERPYVCEICCMQFVCSNHLKRHRMVHTGARPFSCEHCDHQFTTRSNLKIHMRVHSGEKPYECKHCGVHFAHSGSLNQHVANTHVTKDERTD